MRRMSIKARVTLWYSGLLVVLMVIVVLYLLSFTNQIFVKRQRDVLMDVVADTVKSSQFDYGNLDDDKIDFYNKGVSVFLYSTDGSLIAPKVNMGIQVDSVLEDQVVRMVDRGGDQWLVYDIYAVQNGTGFWVRGTIHMSGVRENLKGMVLLALVGVPVFIAIAAFGGFTITRHAFSAVGELAQTADSITSGQDLSLRVLDDGSGDELSRLGYTVNSMLERLQESFEAEKQFNSDVSHELRTPTAVIISQCEYALSKDADEEIRTEALYSIRRQADRITAIISQLLMLVRADNGKFTPKFEQILLSELCEMAVIELEEEAREQGISLNMELEAKVVINGDETLLIRLLTNLIQNAVKYNREGGRVTVRLKQMQRSCLIEVEDTGIGIPKEEQEKIWNRFYRVDSSRSGEGTGLGLTMVRWIARLHGGDVTVTSRYGQGSCFRISLMKN